MNLLDMPPQLPVGDGFSSRGKQRGCIRTLFAIPLDQDGNRGTGFFFQEILHIEFIVIFDSGP